MMHRRGARKMGLFFVCGILAATVVGFVFMNLWNGIVPDVFGGRTITFWQALGVLVLSRFMFGGFFRRPGWGGRGGGCGGRSRFRMVDNWDQLTPEEQEKFRQGMARCGKPMPPRTEPVS